jgi:hypothetical protein
VTIKITGKIPYQQNGWDKKVFKFFDNFFVSNHSASCNGYQFYEEEKPDKILGLLCVCRQQFSLRENVQIGLYGRQGNSIPDTYKHKRILTQRILKVQKETV